MLDVTHSLSNEALESRRLKRERGAVCVFWLSEVLSGVDGRKVANDTGMLVVEERRVDGAVSGLEYSGGLAGGGDCTGGVAVHNDCTCRLAEDRDGVGCVAGAVDRM